MRRHGRKKKRLDGQTSLLLCSVKEMLACVHMHAWRVCVREGISMCG